jgi:hypothetical protein
MISQNVASVITKVQAVGATIKTAAPTNTSSKSAPAGTGSPSGPPYTNPLHQFASYVPLWSMACLTPKQFNDPKSYRGNSSIWLNESYNGKSGAKTQASVIFASAGRLGENRAKTVSGSPEYYIDNFVMNTIVAATEKTGNSNAVAFSFDIYEPYSMGLLLQSMQTSAINAGYASYLDNAPYLLKLEFLGFTDDGKFFGSTEKLARYWTVKFKKIKFSVSEGGSNYKCECIPYSHQGFSNTLNQSFTDIAITGDTLKELLVAGPKSLVSVLNEREQSSSAKQGGTPNKYLVVFPTDASDNVGLEPSVGASLDRATAPPTIIKEQNIGSSSKDPENFGEGPLGIEKNTMGFSPTSGGSYVSKLEGDVRDEKTGLVQRNKMTIDPTVREFKFAQGQSLTDIITQCVMSSDYAKNALDEKNIDATGHISWFRIDVQIQLLEFDVTRNDYAKRIIFRVLPFKVHSDILKNPSSASPGLQQLKKIIAKQYNYIYTGLNVDVLKFDIDIDNMFYTGRPIAPPEQTAVNQNKDINDSASETTNKAELQQGTKPEAIASDTGSKPVKPDASAGLPAAAGGSGDVTTERRVADAFQSAFLKNSADLINLNIDILGDPFWLVDTGLGNYLAPKGPTDQVTGDLTMNYEGSDVYVYVTFRTPVEPNLGTTGQGGLYNFPEGEIVSPFSGIYKVVKCDHKFSGGTFIQTLKLIRMTGQPQDYEGKEQISKSQVLLYKLKEQPKQTSVAEQAIAAGA